MTLRLAAGFSSVTTKTRRRWHKILKMLGEDNLSRSLYSVKLLIKKEGETDIFRQTKTVYH